ncbi:ferrochelatase [Candidatus Photodesmus katoptron]|uniref:Ferrochelatase n=1 Tax=Candidatus Photodesmus katoptron Akat1 TaxID=1236703 RepID=S3DKZ7_9GAMM|nr:ferrochelatase [Candidatus Photodesmus katoptron]EPE37784.1 ferrochelatase [Candidatus Photodesmus katoptron Akat1]KEY90495.1 ferrochelatase [Candidatus Photodesmus katoptron]
MKNSNNLGVLLVNLGSPSKPTMTGVSLFLRQLLSDRRVIDINAWLWYPILYALVLPMRVKKVTKLYQKIWMDEGSPLILYTQRQVQLLNKRLKLPVSSGMTYGSPSLESGVQELLSKKVTDIIILPLFPQYSRTTTAAVFDRLVKVFKKIPLIPTYRLICNYHNHPLYIKALAHSIRKSWKNNGKGDYLLCSYHGIPESYVTRSGDIYPSFCKQTTDLLAQVLELKSKEIGFSYQSRFGRIRWLSPYTDKILKELPNQGIKNVDVLAPGFSCDCLETLEEILVRYKNKYMEAGGRKFTYIPCLNDSTLHIEMIASLVSKS